MKAEDRMKSNTLAINGWILIPIIEGNSNICLSEYGLLTEVVQGSIPAVTKRL